MIGDIAHICNRGIEKRKIFLDTSDYERFVENLFLLNNSKGKIRSSKNIFRAKKLPEQDKLVEVLKWSLLPNHYHLLLYEKREGGILEFTKRLGNAYTKYFNIKNNGRSGYVFQNHAKIIPITDERQALYIPYYIDINPLDLVFSNRKNLLPTSSKKALEFLRQYEWSSYKDYFGKGEQSLLVSKDLFYELFDIQPGKYEEELVKLSTCEVDEFEEYERNLK
jgi:putative transposase